MNKQLFGWTAALIAGVSLMSGCGVTVPIPEDGKRLVIDVDRRSTPLAETAKPGPAAAPAPAATAPIPAPPAAPTAAPAYAPPTPTPAPAAAQIPIPATCRRHVTYDDGPAKVVAGLPERDARGNPICITKSREFRGSCPGHEVIFESSDKPGWQYHIVCPTWQPRAKPVPTQRRRT